MEIALLNESSLRIKGKQGSVIINPQGKAYDADGFIMLDSQVIDSEKISDDALVINGPGEYEFCGIKVSGIRLNSHVVFSIRTDRVEILLGSAEVLEKDHSKLREHHIAVLRINEAVDPAFITSLSSNVIVFYGEKAADAMKQLANDVYRTENKYSVTFEKLPQDIEKILLQ